MVQLSQDLTNSVSNIGGGGPFEPPLRPSVNYRAARGQLNQLIHLAASNDQFGQQYDDIVKTYIEKEFIEQIPNDPIVGTLHAASRSIQKERHHTTTHCL